MFFSINNSELCDCTHTQAPHHLMVSLKRKFGEMLLIAHVDFRVNKPEILFVLSYSGLNILTCSEKNILRAQKHL